MTTPQSRIDAIEHERDALAAQVEAVGWISDNCVTLEPNKAKQWQKNGYEVNPLFSPRLRRSRKAWC